MAADFIQINRANLNTTAVKGQDLLEFRSLLRAAYEKGVAIRATMRHNFNDQVNPIDWAQVEALYGIPAGKGSTIFTFIDGSIGAMEGAFQNDASKVFTEQVG